MKKRFLTISIIVLLAIIMGMLAFVSCGAKVDRIESDDKTASGETGASTGQTEAKGILSADVNENGELILTFTDGTTENLGAVGGQKRYIVNVYYVGDELWAEYSDGISEKISVDGSSTCKHENAVYTEQVAHKMNADGTFTNGIYLMFCPDCRLSKTISDVMHDFKECVVAPTCTDDGYICKVCPVCGYKTDKEKTADALGHNVDIRPSKSGSEAREWCENGGETIKYCTRCNETLETFDLEPYEALGHISDNWSLVSPPSYNTSGTIGGVCKNCGNFASKMIPACCDAAYTVSDILPEGASCSAEKTGTFTVTIDGQDIAIEKVAIPGSLHTFKGEEVDERVTKVFTDKAAFDASGLKLMGNTSALTCSTTSQAYFTCDECGEIIAISVRKRHASADSAKDHVKVDETGKEWYATCEHDGILIIDCATCKAEKEEVIPAVGHDYVYTWDKDAGSLIGICQNIANEKVKTCENAYDVIDNLKKVETEVVKAATCNKDGLIKYTLTKNDNTVIVKNVVTSKHDHSLTKTDGSVVSISDATGKRYSVSAYPEITPFGNAVVSCAADFGGGFTCAECKEYIAVTLYKAHTIKEGTLIEHPATCTTPGTRDYTCTVCGDDKPIKDEKYEDALGHDYAWTSVDKEDSADGKYHLVGICRRELTDGAGETEICGDTKDYSSAKPFEVRVILEPTCACEGQTNYTIVNDDGTTGTFKVVVPKLNHTLNGEKINYREPVSSTKKGVSYFGNSYIKLACDGNGVPGYFKCDDCGQIISVSVKKPHTPDESTIEITDDGHKHYTCSVCGQSVDETDG